MNHTYSRRVLVLLAAGALAPACAGEGSEPGTSAPVVQTPSGGGDHPAAVASPSGGEDHPAAIASLTLEPGHVVEFFEFDSGVLITERASASTLPVLDKLAPRGTINGLETWKQLSGGAEAPASLLAAYERLSNRKQTAIPPDQGQLSGQWGGEELAPVEPVVEEDPNLLAAPSGCNNHCCDYSWLSTLSQCRNPESYNWFGYNYGATWANSGSDIKNFRGMVCAATGTSVWKVQIGGFGGTWSVPEATSLTYAWDASCYFPFGCFDYPAVTSVNTSANQHLHTYCGGFYY